MPVETSGGVSAPLVHHKSASARNQKQPGGPHGPSPGRSYSGLDAESAFSAADGALSDTGAAVPTVIAAGSAAAAVNEATTPSTPAQAVTQRSKNRPRGMVPVLSHQVRTASLER